MIKDLLNKFEKQTILPFVLTNENLKELFQVKDTTLNNLINFADFPVNWYGIRGHYLRNDIIEWLEKKDYQEFICKMKTLRTH